MTLREKIGTKIERVVSQHSTMYDRCSGEYIREVLNSYKHLFNEQCLESMFIYLFTKYGSNLKN